MQENWQNPQYSLGNKDSNLVFSTFNGALFIRRFVRKGGDGGKPIQFQGGYDFLNVLRREVMEITRAIPGTTRPIIMGIRDKDSGKINTRGIIKFIKDERSLYLVTVEMGGVTHSYSFRGDYNYPIQTGNEAANDRDTSALALETFELWLKDIAPIGMVLSNVKSQKQGGGNYRGNNRGGGNSGGGGADSGSSWDD